MAGLSLRHICKIYPAKKEFNLFRKKTEDGKRSGDFLAVDDFNMEIDDGEFIVFVGPSGCGKSTTLRMIAGLEDITSGELYIGDKLVNELEPMERDIAMVFQSYALYPHMTAFDNIAFGLKMRKKPVRVLPSEINEQLKSLNISVSEIEKALRIAQKQLIKAKKTSDKDERVRLESYISEKEDELNSIRNKINDLIADAPEVLAIDRRKVSELKRAYKNACADLKYCETQEEKDEYSARAEKIKSELDYYSATPVTAYVWKRYDKSEVEEKVNNAAKILGIEELLDTKPSAMSGGQRQRVALGRAIVRDPKVFLLDEPLSNLDAKLRTAMRTEIVKLHDELKTTFIYVTHDQVEAMTMGSRIVVMKSGIVQQIDTPVNLFDFPRNKFVAGFIGTPQMNFFDVTIKKSASNLIIRFDNGDELKYALKDMRSINDAYLDGSEHSVFLGVRGEHISVAETGLTVNVHAKEILGSTTQLFFDLDNTRQNYVIVLNERNDYSAKQKLYVKFQSQYIHLFDKETELSIMGRESEK